eukprot:g2135.t1
MPTYQRGILFRILYALMMVVIIITINVYGENNSAETPTAENMNQGRRLPLLRKGLILKHDQFKLKLIRPLGPSHVSSVSFIEMSKSTTLTKKRALGSGAFGTVWMCDMSTTNDRGNPVKKVVAAKIMNHIPIAKEMSGDASVEGDSSLCAGPDVWPVPPIQVINSFFREAAFAKAIERNPITTKLIGKHFVKFYGLHFVQEEKSSRKDDDFVAEGGEDEEDTMIVSSEGSSEQMALLLLEVMENMDDLTCIPSELKRCHWELTNFVSAPELRDKFLEHGETLVDNLLGIASALGQANLVHHDIWEDNVIVRADFAGGEIKYSALLIDFGVSIDCNNVPTDVGGSICSRRQHRKKLEVGRAQPQSSLMPKPVSLRRRSQSAPGSIGRDDTPRFKSDKVINSLQHDDSIAHAYYDEQCCTDLFRGYFNSYFGRHEEGLVKDGTHSSGKRVCEQFYRDEDKAKMDKVMILVMLEKIYGLQFGVPRWSDEPDELASRMVLRDQASGALMRELKWLSDRIGVLRENLNYHTGCPLLPQKRGASVTEPPTGVASCPIL